MATPRRGRGGRGRRPRGRTAVDAGKRGRPGGGRREGAEVGAALARGGGRGAPFHGTSRGGQGSTHGVWGGLSLRRAQQTRLTDDFHVQILKFYGSKITLKLIYKKSSGNGSISLFLGKRNFVDHVDRVDIVDGVLKVDPSKLEGRKVWVQLVCAFRYGQEDLDVIGLPFRKDICIQHVQVYPPENGQPANTPTQDALMKKVGEQGHPFTFTIPNNLPCSVTLQPAPDDKGKPCGVDYELKGYIANKADTPAENVEKKDTCRLIIRKIQLAPDRAGVGPKAAVSRQFMTSDKLVHLEASLGKEVYCHGDPIKVKVKINNETSYVVKKIKITVDQTADVLLYSADKYTKCVLNEEFGDSVNGNATFEKEYRVTPSLANSKEKRGLALDGRLKDKDTNLASTATLRPGLNRDVAGILVSYKVKVNLMVSSGGFLGDLTASDVCVELPLILMSPKPADV
ncbi:arrestin 3b, retinal (X-arrestin) [Conger conger]|uniref:arrestin 3b, retinal (X-arrestin) n=1 Tax=Conger conger TaxID=82655 RepID=UPI002A5A3138|nr:arrestin 3b, retinal (X-arrestin) [Conger conger]